MHATGAGAAPTARAAAQPGCCCFPSWLSGSILQELQPGRAMHNILRNGHPGSGVSAARALPPMGPKARPLCSAPRLLAGGIPVLEGRLGVKGNMQPT
jgi:hypothetical protein